MSGDGLQRYTQLIAAGYADYKLVVNNANQLYSYTVWLTDKGKQLLSAWTSGNREQVKRIIG